MKKLIEFQEEKHSDVLDTISKFRAENNTTFSEAVRQLIMLSQNGCDIPESVIYTTPDPKIEEIDEKLEKLFGIVKKHIKKHTEGGKGI